MPSLQTEQDVAYYVSIVVLGLTVLLYAVVGVCIVYDYFFGRRWKK